MDLIFLLIRRLSDIKQWYVHCEKVSLVLCASSFLIASTFIDVIPHSRLAYSRCTTDRESSSQFQLSSLLQHISLGMVVHILKSDDI